MEAMAAMAQRNRSFVQKWRFFHGKLHRRLGEDKSQPRWSWGQGTGCLVDFPSSSRRPLGVVSLDMSHLDMHDMVLFALHVEFLMRICHVDPCSMFPILTDPQLTLFQGINAGVMLWQPNQEMLDEMLAELDEPNHPEHVRCTSFDHFTESLNPWMYFSLGGSVVGN